MVRSMPSMGLRDDDHPIPTTLRFAHQTAPITKNKAHQAFMPSASWLQRGFGLSGNLGAHLLYNIRMACFTLVRKTIRPSGPTRFNRPVHASLGIVSNRFLPKDHLDHSMGPAIGSTRPIRAKYRWIGASQLKSISLLRFSQY